MGCSIENGMSWVSWWGSNPLRSPQLTFYLIEGLSTYNRPMKEQPRGSCTLVGMQRTTNIWNDKVSHQLMTWSHQEEEGMWLWAMAQVFWNLFLHFLLAPSPWRRDNPFVFTFPSLSEQTTLISYPMSLKSFWLSILFWLEEVITRRSSRFILSPL